MREAARALVSLRLDLRPVVVVFCLALLVALWAALLTDLAQERERVIESTKLQTANLVAAFDEHVTRTLRNANMVLVQVKKDYEKYRKVDITEHLANLTFDREIFNTISVANEHGEQIAASYAVKRPQNWSNSENFRYHETHDSADLYISRPRLGMTTGKWSIYLSQRLDHPDGKFAGDVTLALDIGYFSGFYRQFDLGGDGVIVLIGRDGIIRARNSDGKLTAGEDRSNTTLISWRLAENDKGSYVGKGNTDGVVRIFSYRALKNYPLVVLVGISEAHALQGFYGERLTRIGWAAIISIVIVLFAALMISQLSRLARINRQLRVSEAKYRALIETTDTGYLVLDSNGRVVDANENYVRMSGHQALADIAGRHVMEWTAEHDRERNAREVAACLESGRVLNLEVEYRGRDGGTVPVEINAVVVGEGGERQILSMCRDVSARRRAESDQLLAASVFSSAAEGIMITDSNNNILLVNSAFTRIMGYKPREVIGRNPRLFQSGHTSRELYERMWQGLQTKGYWTGEIEDRRGEQDSVWLQLSICAVRDKAGRITHHHAIFADITLRKRAEAQLEQLNADLERRVEERTAELTRANRNLEMANKDLEAFSYSVSHDLRAPLRSILGHSSHALEAKPDHLDAGTVERLTRIKSSGERMARLIDDLLNLSRFSRQTMRRQEIDLSVIATEVVGGLAQIHPRHDVETIIKPGMQCSGDHGLMFIVLQNLLDNAWKYSSRVEAAKIEFGTEMRGGETVYFIRDNGAGFDMKYAARLFGVFQRLHSDADFQGTGIGLSIVHRIVTRHGGRIWAESAPGAGATFYFTLGSSAQEPADPSMMASIQ